MISIKTQEDIKKRIIEVKQRIEIAKDKGGNEQPVTLVAVSKTKPVEMIEASIQCQQFTFGENRAQELKQKFEYINSIDYNEVNWHMIGRLQKNKVKYIVGVANLIHSIDSLSIIEEINRISSKIDVHTNILLQVNVSGEETKGGIDPTKINQFIDQALAYENVNIKGLMTMAPYINDEKVLRNIFAKTNGIYKKVASEYSELDFEYLSMGMTNDYELAIQEGSNMVRVGRAIYGERG